MPYTRSAKGNSVHNGVEYCLCGKILFYSRREAWETAMALSSRMGGRRAYVYSCHEGFYHLTSRPRQRPQVRTVYLKAWERKVAELQESA